SWRGAGLSGRPLFALLRGGCFGCGRFFLARLDHHVDPRARGGDVVVGGATGVDDLALGVIDDLFALEGVAFLDDLGLVDQHDALVGGEILDGQAVGLDDLLVHRRLLLVIGRLAYGGEDFDIAVGILGDGHGIAGDDHGALGDDHVAAIDRNALIVVQFGGVGLDADGLVAVFGKCP